MAIVMISSLFKGGREELAETLAEKTNWPVVSREDLLDRARDLGVRIGRLETAMVKSPAAQEKLAREKELYLALITATLCEKAREGNFIYYGRVGHLLLPGISERVRIGVSVPMETRIDRTAKHLQVSQEKAKAFLEQLDDDTKKWSRFIHQVNGYDPSFFDVVFNLETISVENAAEMISVMASMPDFAHNPTEESQLDNLYLASKARLRLAQDDRTGEADLQVVANNGVLTVTYPPQQEAISSRIPEVLENLEGCRKIQCTMAETNILWIQERFEPKSENFQEIIKLSQRWGAAVELMRLVSPDDEAAAELSKDGTVVNPFVRKTCDMSDTGGVEDDDPETAEDGGLTKTQEELIRLGRSGGIQSVCGGYKQILENVKSGSQYALVVVGNMFLSKGHSAQIRMTRELVLNIRDRLKAPVINATELKSEFLFGPKQGLQLLGYTALVVLLFLAVFTHQEQLFAFLAGPSHEQMKWLSPLVIFLFVPFIAFLYGAVTGLLLKLINID